MGGVGILRELWRRRWLVFVGALLAVSAGILVAYHVSFPAHLQSRQYQVGIASSSALIDTPSSQVVDLGMRSSAAGPSLPGRAALLASLLTTSPLKDEIARRAGIDPRTLIATAPAAEVAASGAKKSTPLATGATVSPDSPRANFITLQTDVTLPIITVNTESRDPAVARALADGTVATLQSHVEALAGRDGVPVDQRLSVEQLGAANTAIQTRGLGPGMGIVAAVIVFLLACAAILIVSSMAREWRRSAAMEAEQTRLLDAPHYAPPEPHPQLGGESAGPAAQDRLRRDIVA